MSGKLRYDRAGRIHPKVRVGGQQHGIALRRASVALEACQLELREARDRLSVANERIAELEARLGRVS